MKSFERYLTPLFVESTELLFPPFAEDRVSKKKKKKRAKEEKKKRDEKNKKRALSGIPLGAKRWDINNYKNKFIYGVCFVEQFHPVLHLSQLIYKQLKPHDFWAHHAQCSGT